MPLGTYYIDSNDFTTATAIFTNVTLSVYAATGYYQNCGVYRYWDQATKILGPVTTCPTCNTADCGTNPADGWQTSQQGIYDFSIDLPAAVGAWRIKITPASLPNALIVTLGGVPYSTFQSSSNFGYIGAGPYYGDTPTAAAYQFPTLSPYYVAQQVWDGTVNGLTT